jgi:hypothetical protein
MIINQRRISLCPYLFSVSSVFASPDIHYSLYDQIIDGILSLVNHLFLAIICVHAQPIKYIDSE